MSRTSDKRSNLCKAAKYLIHKQGFNLTTLADIAKKADIPLGNVYYYFKTKDAIGEAVIANYAKELNAQLHLWEQHTDPRARLTAMLNNEVEQAEFTSISGCPVGSLCQELAKQGGLLAEAANKLLIDKLHWCEKQFHAMGHGQQAQDLAMQFTAFIQGTALLASAFKDPQVVIKMSTLTEEWLRSLCGTPQISTKKHDAKILDVA